MRFVLMTMIGGLLLILPAANAAEPQFGLGTVGAADRLGVACWFWSEAEFQPEGYKAFLDAYAEHAACRLLTTSIRWPVEVTDPAVHDQIAAATAYARERGMGIAFDLDVRLARAAFQAKYPDEMQEIVRLREIALAGTGNVRLRTESLSLGDHYTFKARPYEAIAGRLLRVYSYVRTPLGIAADSLVDITDQCSIVEAGKEGVEVVIACGPADAGHAACVLSAFTLFTPAVFAPHLPDFERYILEGYAGVPLAGACKDEWGFPGRFNPDTTDLWYSRYMDAAYAARRPGRDLVADLVLMTWGVEGEEGACAAAINHYMEMLRERNVALEKAFRDNVKAVFGAEAYIGTHPTWFPFPGANEAFKNGLNWWAVPRDIAQTDETTPYCVRTALAKKWGSASWLNMYYAPTEEDYANDIWRHALGGGRMNFHPVWPSEWSRLQRSLLGGELQQADDRIRMLDFIATAPIDCPVAVFFGHPAFLNWAGDSFADAGVDLANALWSRGIYADLIPTSEIASGAVRVDGNGHIAYGRQRYTAAVLYHPEYESSAIADFFRKAAAGDKTTLFRVGSWTRDFDGNPMDGNALPMAAAAVDDCVTSIAEIVTASGMPLQPACEVRQLHGFPSSMVPMRHGICRLLDGTVVIASGETSVMGDPIQTTIDMNGRPITLDAVGIAAVRLDAEGHLEALACGGLKHFNGGGLDFDLPVRRDIAVWRDGGGALHGAIRGADSAPAVLNALTTDWQHVFVPTPYVRAEESSPH